MAEGSSICVVLQVYLLYYPMCLPLSLTECTPGIIQLSNSSNRIAGVEIIKHYNYYALFSLRCGVSKYCCSVYGTVWCEEIVRSANWARGMNCLHVCKGGRGGVYCVLRYIIPVLFTQVVCLSTKQ